MIILASSSPRRKQLLKQICDDFVIESMNIDESFSTHLTYLKAVEDIAYRKGVCVKQMHPKDIVISADTIVTIDNKIIGKPKDKKDAKNILLMLSNKKHTVITSYCIFYDNQVIQRSIHTIVKMNNLSLDLIDKYIASGSPMDKAGAYGIQDNDKYPIIDYYEGSLNNVIGFPLEEIKKDLNDNHLL